MTTSPAFCLLILILFLVLHSFLAVRMTIMMSASHPVTDPEYAVIKICQTRIIVKIT